MYLYAHCKSRQVCFFTQIILLKACVCVCFPSCALQPLLACAGTSVVFCHAWTAFVQWFALSSSHLCPNPAQVMNGKNTRVCRLGKNCIESERGHFKGHAAAHPATPPSTNRALPKRWGAQRIIVRVPPTGHCELRGNGGQCCKAARKKRPHASHHTGFK